MMNSELLQQVRVLDPVSGTDQLADVLIVDGLIKAVETSISEIPGDTLVRNCQGLILGPGLVDLYSHSGEPGFEERETWLSLMESAAAGGFTRLAILPDTIPALWFTGKSCDRRIHCPSCHLGSRRHDWHSRPSHAYFYSS